MLINALLGDHVERVGEFITCLELPRILWWTQNMAYHARKREWCIDGWSQIGTSNLASSNNGVCYN